VQIIFHSDTQSHMPVGVTVDLQKLIRFLCQKVGS